MPRALRSVRLHGGQGDVIMAVHGLQALRELGRKILADDAVVYTRSIAAPVARLLLPDIAIKSLEDSKHAAHPRGVSSAGARGAPAKLPLRHSWLSQR